MDDLRFVGRQPDLGEIVSLWESIVSESESGPKIVALIGESGIGKTRLAQEFYLHLVKKHASNKYWFQEISGTTPQFDNQRFPDIPLSFLWWGLEGTGRGSTLEAFLPDVAVHLKPMFNSRVRRSLGKNATSLLVEAAMGVAANYFTGGALSICEALSNIRNIHEARQIYNQSRKGFEEKNIVDEQDEKILGDFRSLFDKPREGLICALANQIRDYSATDMDAIPMVLLLDRIEEIDERSEIFFIKFIAEAFEKKWPVLVLLTCEASAWRGSDSPELKRECSKLFDDKHSQSFIVKELGSLSDQDVDSTIRLIFPGLDDNQVRVLANKIAGHPLILDEAIRLLHRHKKWFVDGDSSQPLSEQGLQRVHKGKFQVHRLIKERIEAEGEACADIVGLASYQGYQFSDRLVIELAKRLNAVGDNDLAEKLLSKANDPLNVIRQLTRNVSEFSHTAYYEVARDFFEELKEVSPEVSNIMAEQMIDWLALTDKPAESSREEELLSLLALDVIPSDQSLTTEQGFLARLARVRAKSTLLLHRRGFSDDKEYLDECYELIEVFSEDRKNLSGILYPLEMAIEALFTCYADGIRRPEKALDILEFIILSYLEKATVDSSAEMPFKVINALSLYASAVKRTEGSMIFEPSNDDEWVIDNGSLDLIQEGLGERVDKFICQVEQVDSRVPSYLKLAGKAFLTYAKDLLGKDPDKSYKALLIQCCRRCINERVPEDVVGKVLESTLYEISSGIDGMEFFHESIAYLESLGGNSRNTGIFRQCYNLALSNLILNSDSIENQIELYRKQVQIGLAAIEQDGFEAVRQERCFLEAIQSATGVMVLASGDYHEALSHICSLLSEALPILEKRHERYFILDVAEPVIHALVLRTKEGGQDPAGFAHKVAAEVFEKMGINNSVLDVGVGVDVFLSLCLIRTLMHRLGIIINSQNPKIKRQQIQTLKQLIDEIQKVNSRVDLLKTPDWQTIEKFCYDYRISTNVGSEMVKYISDKIDQPTTGLRRQKSALYMLRTCF